MSATTSLGKVSADVAEAFAYLMSPAAIDDEVRRLQAAVATGDTSPATAALLADWRTIKDAQRRLLVDEAAA